MKMKNSGYLYLDMDSKTPLSDAIRREVFNQGINYSILITGRTQSRKSTTGLALSLLMDPSFDFHKDFAIIKTKDMIKTLSTEGKRGNVKFLDEIGVGLDHHVWFQFMQKAMSYIMQTHGYEGKIVVATAPFGDVINKDILKLFNMHIKIIGKNENKRFAVAKVTTIEYNEDEKKVYKKYPRGRYPDKSVKIIKAFRIKFPPQEKLDEYFKLSNDQKKMLHFDLMATSDKLEADKVKKLFSPEYYADMVAKEPEKYMGNFYGRKFISREKIMNNFPGIGDTRARQIKTLAEEKLRGEGAII